MKRFPVWSWLWVIIGAAYMFVPLYGTLDFSLRAKKGEITLLAYQRVFEDDAFFGSMKEVTEKDWNKAVEPPKHPEEASWAERLERVTVTAGTFGISVSLGDFVGVIKSGTIFYKFAAGAFLFSAIMGILTIIASLALIVPTAYWIHLKVPGMRPYVEFVTLLPFVIPPIVYVFGLIRTFSRPPLLLTATPFTTNILLIGGYVVVTMPYVYRAVDTGLRAIDVRTLTEAAQSLGANWVTIIVRVIFPNLRVALLSGVLITFAVVMGEFILAQYLARPAFGPYLVRLGQDKAYEPAALTIVSFILLGLLLGPVTFFNRGVPGQGGGRV
ncbi:MAG TPA: ABC transporter permease subunit [Anaerolineales bacterium]|nr:ABC transporter permease subunit [Anaerolineales bacterium]